MLVMPKTFFLTLGLMAVLVVSLSCEKPLAKNSTGDKPPTPHTQEQQSTQQKIALIDLLGQNEFACIQLKNIEQFITKCANTDLARAIGEKSLKPLKDQIQSQIPNQLRMQLIMGLNMLHSLIKCCNTELLFAYTYRAGLFDYVLLANINQTDEAKTLFSSLPTMMTLIGLKSNAAEFEGISINSLLDANSKQIAAYGISGGILMLSNSTEFIKEIITRKKQFKSNNELRPTSKNFIGNTDYDYRIFATSDMVISGLGLFLPQKLMQLFLLELDGTSIKSFELLGQIGDNTSSAFGGSFKERIKLTPLNISTTLGLGKAKLTYAASTRFKKDTLIAGFANIKGDELATTLSRYDIGLRDISPTLDIIVTELLGSDRGESILRNIEGESAISYFNDARMGWFPGMGFVLNSKNTTRLEQSLALAMRNIANRFGARTTRKTIEHNQKTIELNHIQDAKYFMPYFCNSAFTRSGETIIASNYIKPLLNMAVEQKPTKTLAESKLFNQVKSNLATDTDIFLYINTAELIRLGFEPYAPLLIETFLGKPLATFEREKLPPGENLARHFGPSGISVLKAEDGIIIETLSPTGLIGGAILQAIPTLKDMADSTIPATSK